MEQVAHTAEADPSDDIPPLSSAIVQREDGVWLLTALSRADCQAAAGHVFLSGSCFLGLDYAIFQRMLFGAGPDMPAGLLAQPMVRMADAIAPFPSGRRGLYKTVKLVGGDADYFFEPVFLETGEGELRPAMLHFDEFVADMWIKGIRFGIDASVVCEAIESGKKVRRIVARRLDPVPGRDAAVVEVSPDLHRSNAPRELANGRFDLHTFQNRFPQVQARERLLRKEPRTEGSRGFELSGQPIEPTVGKDLELTSVAGTGTVIEHVDGVDYLVAATDGFINVDSKSGRISIGPKIISRDGVSARTTGNLQLTGAYEELGEVQENRVVEGGDITIHGNVFGNIASRGGEVLLKRNVIGGTVVNANGAVHIGGVVSNAVVQTRQGEVTICSAQNCVITGTKVTISEAINCEIIAEEVVIGNASGCAIAARSMALNFAGPRKQNEMLLFALVPDTTRYDDAITELDARAGVLAAAVERHRAGVDDIAGRQEVRSYLSLAERVRKRELLLTPAQVPLFRKMAARVVPMLQEAARLVNAGKAAEAQREQLLAQAAEVRQRRVDVAGVATCKVKMLDGDTVLRTMMFHPDGEAPYLQAPREIRARVRARSWKHAPILQAWRGAIDWSSAS